jgi:hypothetical protein
MTAYQIKLRGCDDSTAFVMHLTDSEAATIRQAAEASCEASDYGCQPTMTIGPPPADEDGET